MEPASLESISLRRRLSISSLSVDCLDIVLSYSGPNAALYFILTGDAIIINKVKRTSTLSLRWESSAYFDWSAALPLINLFSSLHSLSLTTWSPSLLPRERLKQGLLPPTLKSLELSFNDVFILLNTHHWPELLSTVRALESLSVSSENTADQELYLRLDHFPKSLRSFRLRAPTPVVIDYAASRLEDLPPDLETLHLRVTPMSRYTKEQIKLGKGVPGGLYSLTSLAIYVDREHSVDLTCVGPRLKHLELLGGGKALMAKGTVSAFNDEIPPRKHFPRLETLKTDAFKLFHWNNLEMLPPTLTQLSVPISKTLASPASALASLNNRFNGLSDIPTHAIPKNLRLFEILHREDIPSFTDSATLQHFSSLTSLNSCKLSSSCKPTDLSFPKSLTALTLDFAKLSWLKLLPPSLLSLHLLDLSITEDQGRGRRGNRLIEASSNAETEEILQGLSALRIDNVYFPLELVHVLPRSLESLTVELDGHDVLMALTARSKVGSLPLLKTLSIDGVGAHQGKVPIFELSMDSIPSTVCTLMLGGVISFPSGSSPHSLRHHLSLTFLRLSLPVKPLELFKHLPRSLRTLYVNFAQNIDVANPHEALELFLLRERVPRLREFYLNKTTGQANFDWIWRFPSLQELPSRLARWMSLPMSLQLIYIRAIWKSLWIESSLLLGPLIGFACLPRRLSTFSMPVSHRLYWHVSDIAYLLLATFKYQIPILGLALFRESDYRYDDVNDAGFIDMLPTQLSDVSGINAGILNKAIYAEETGHTPLNIYDLKKPNGPWVSPSEALYHAFNLVTWLIVAKNAPMTRWTPTWLLQGYMWSSIIGSAISLPYCLWQSISHRRHHGYTLFESKPGWKIFGVWGGICSLATVTSYFALSSSPYGLWSQIGVGVLAVGASLLRNYLVWRHRK